MLEQFDVMGGVGAGRGTLRDFFFAAGITQSLSKVDSTDLCRIAFTLLNIMVEVTRSTRTKIRELRNKLRNATTQVTFSNEQMITQSRLNMKEREVLPSTLSTGSVPASNDCREEDVVMEESASVVVVEQSSVLKRVEELKEFKPLKFEPSAMCAQAMMNMSASTAGKSEVSFQDLVTGTELARKEEGKFGEPNIAGRGALHKLFGGRSTQGGEKTQAVVRLRDNRNGQSLGDVFIGHDLDRFIGKGTGSDGTRIPGTKVFADLKSGAIDIYIYKDFNVTLHDPEKDGLAAYPNESQIEQINAITALPKWNGAEMGAQKRSHGRVAAIVPKGRTFKGGLEGREHPKDAQKMIITTGSVGALMNMKAVHRYYNGDTYQGDEKMLQNAIKRGSLKWRDGVTIEWFDEKRHGEYVDDRNGTNSGKKRSASKQKKQVKRSKRTKENLWRQYELC